MNSTTIGNLELFDLLSTFQEKVLTSGNTSTLEIIEQLEGELAVLKVTLLLQRQQFLEHDDDDDDPTVNTAPTAATSTAANNADDNGHTYVDDSIERGQHSNYPVLIEPDEADHSINQSQPSSSFDLVTSTFPTEITAYSSYGNINNDNNNENLRPVVPANARIIDVVLPSPNDENNNDNNNNDIIIPRQEHAIRRAQVEFGINHLYRSTIAINQATQSIIPIGFGFTLVRVVSLRSGDILDKYIEYTSKGGHVWNTKRQRPPEECRYCNRYHWEYQCPFAKHDLTLDVVPDFIVGPLCERIERVE